MTVTFILFALALVTALRVHAESHTIRFVNNCGHGTPALVKGGQIMSNGSDYTSDGPFESAIAYLQTGNCLLNGEACTLVEMNMNNPACAGCGSSVDISLIAPHAYNVETAFAFFGGNGDVCDGLGAICADANCDTAFFNPNDNQVQRACQADNVGLMITFCGSGQTSFTEAVVGSLSGQSSSGSSASGASPSSSESASPTSSTIHSSSGPNSVSSKSASSTSSTPTSSSEVVTPPSSVAGGSSTPTTTVNVGFSSADSSSSPTAAAPSSTKTCSRKSTRRAKRSASHAKKAHVRSRARARAFGGVHESF
ncbi:hypothetical protein DFH11DRAFT_1564475 [Phellopilus nigrolimitatus]|nr:hypothetical protein DFH11DRAFT_1564475 [Phellopilus nigrolimitatus]